MVENELESVITAHTILYFVRVRFHKQRKIVLIYHKEIQSWLSLNQGRSEGRVLGCPWPPPFGGLFISKMNNIQYLGGENAQIWKIFNTLAPKTTVRKLTVEIFSHQSNLDMTMCWVPWVWRTVTPPLKNPGYATVSLTQTIESSKEICGYLRLGTESGVKLVISLNPFITGWLQQSWIFCLFEILKFNICVSNAVWMFVYLYIINCSHHYRNRHLN